MLIIQSLFSRLRNIQTRNRGEIVIPASAPQESGLRLDNDWLFVQQKGEGWMRPTFVLQHLHFFGLSYNPSSLSYSSSEKRKVWHCYDRCRYQNQHDRPHNKSCNLLMPLLVHTSCRIMRNASSMLL